MFHYILRSVFHGRQTITASQSHLLFNSGTSILRLCNALRFVSTSSHQQSFTVSYLINKFGFSEESALKVSKNLRLKTSDKPDSVISFLEEKGFSKTQIKSLVTKFPKLLRFSVEETLSPKWEFFSSRGFTSPELAKYLSFFPSIFRTSLDKQIIPSFNFLSNLLESDDKAIKVLKRCAFIICYDLNAYMLPNINFLLDNGVPKSNLLPVVTWHPEAFLFYSDRFKEIVKEVKKRGFNPLTMKFIHAVVVWRQVSKSTWEGKFVVYKKWGWSEEQIWEAFLKYPCVMVASEQRIAATMDFLVNVMGFQSAVIAKQASVMGRSLKKRIVPRGLFVQYLKSEGLVAKNFALSTLFDTSEKEFLERFVYRYEDKAPELLQLYKEKVDLAVGEHRTS